MTIFETLLVVLSRPITGRAADYNDWYSHIHIRDALRFGGSLSAQRFAPLAGTAEAEAQTHLALYELSDAAAFTQGHRDWAGTPAYRTSSAFDRSDFSEYGYCPTLFQRLRPELSCSGAVVLEQYVAQAMTQGALCEWLQGPRAQMMRANSNLVSRTVAVLGEGHQLLATPASYNVVVINRVCDIAAATRSWSGADSPADAGSARADVSYWTPITPLLTAKDVLNPAAAAMAAEEQARERMGTDYLPPNPLLRQ